jgi:hypothetical protein
MRRTAIALLFSGLAVCNAIQRKDSNGRSSWTARQRQGEMAPGGLRYRTRRGQIASDQASGLTGPKGVARAAARVFCGSDTKSDRPQHAHIVQALSGAGSSSGQVAISRSFLHVVVSIFTSVKCLEALEKARADLEERVDLLGPQLVARLGHLRRADEEGAPSSRPHFSPPPLVLHLLVDAIGGRLIFGRRLPRRPGLRPLHPTFDVLHSLRDVV